MASYTKGVRETRNRLMKTDQVLGMTVGEMAEKYRLTPGQVKKGLAEAEKAGVLELLERGIYSDIMPKALAVLEAHLDEGKSLKAVEIAMALFGAMKTSVKAKNSFEVSVAPGQNVGIVALDAIRQEKVINASFGQRHDGGSAPHHRGEEDPGGPLRGPSAELEREDPPGGG
jgi:hypothetical protein